MHEQEIVKKMPKGTSPELSIKEVSRGEEKGIEVSCQGSAAGISEILIAAMSHPVIKLDILTAVGVYFQKEGKELESLIIGKELLESQVDFRNKMNEAKESGE